MATKPRLWGLTDDEIIDELDRFAYWWEAPYATDEQRVFAVIAEAVKRILKKGKKTK